MSTTTPTTSGSSATSGRPGERHIDLGPGLIRTADGAYHRPTTAAFHVNCLGPLATWGVKAKFTLPSLPEGDEPFLFLYPLPSEAALSTVLVQGEGVMKSSSSVKARTELPESCERPAPSASLIETFGKETMPVLTIELSSFASHFRGQKAVEIELNFSSGLPTVDGRILLEVPGAVESGLSASGKTILDLSVEIEDSAELVDEPTSSSPLVPSKSGEVYRLAGSFEGHPKDIAVSFRHGSTQMPVTRLRRTNDHFIFSIFPPTSIPASPQRRDIVFAVDASENVLSGIFPEIRAALCSALRGLDENDRFALVTFGRDIDGYQGGEFCEIGEVEEACTWLEQSQPKGQANVQPLLERIQSLPAQPDRQLCVFLLAAGHVGNEPSILKSLDFDQSDRRYYTVGIGNSAQQAFLRRLALLTRGRCEVSQKAGCGEALERLLGQTRALLAEVMFEGQDGNAADLDESSLVPSKMTSLTPHGPVHCLGKGSPSSLRFRSKDETGVFYAGTVNARTTTSMALAGVWAGLRVRELSDWVKLTTGAKRKSLREECSRIASDHGVLTDETLLVLEVNGGTEVQLSAFPSTWRKDALAAAKPDDSGEAPFDWRKGLVARDGLFKGGKPNDGGAGQVRPGLRKRGGKSSEKPSGKPMLNRTFMADPGINGGDDDHLEAGEEQFVAGGTAVPVPVADSYNPVMSLGNDPWLEGRIRLDSYQDQVSALDTRMALAALAGMPAEVSTSGPDLPRVLAQTVAHLEKRGYYSSAVSILGLLLRDYSSPEVLQKMESLLCGWAESLEDHHLPEALHIVQTGQRICPDSTALKSKAQEVWAKWSELVDSQEELAEMKTWRGANTDSDMTQLLSEPQKHLVKLESQQASLGSEMSELRAKVDGAMGALPDLIESLVASASEAASQAAQEAAKLAAASVGEQLATQIEALKKSVPAPAIQAPASPPATVAPQPEVPAEIKPSPPAASPEPVKPTPVEEADLPDLDIPMPAASSSPTPEAPAIDIPLPEAKVESPGAAPAERETLELSEPQAVAVESTPDASAEAKAPAVDSQGPTDVEPEAMTSQAVEVVPAVQQESESAEASMVMHPEELEEMLKAAPDDPEAHASVKASLPDHKDRIAFYRDLVKSEKDQPYHSLSLARAYREADQTKVAVVHYQKYLRSEKDGAAYLELAEVYDELGKSNLSASARKAAEVYSG